MIHKPIKTSFPQLLLLLTVSPLVVGILILVASILLVALGLRSLVAVLTFMATAFATAHLVLALGGGR